MNLTRIRTKTAALLSAAMLLCGALQSASAQTAAAPSEGPVIKGGTEEVLLDLVVRDKKGRTVRDLQPGDVEVFDNGQPVKFKTFRLVEGVEATSVTGGQGVPGKKMTLDPMRQIRLVTLVFERLSDNGRRLARQAALDLVKDDLGQNVFYSVFSIDFQLSVLQPFTNDRELLRKAIDHATSGAYTQFASDSAQIRQHLENMLGGTGDAGAGQTAASRIGTMAAPTNSFGAPTGGQVSAMQAQLVLNMLQFDEKTATDQSGRSSIYSMLSLVRGQAPLPGRKTVLYFNEGLHVPPALLDQFRGVISAANRANVSVYPVDARGLLSGRQSQAGGDSLAGALASARNQQMSGGRGAVTPDQVQAADRAEGSIRADVQTAMAELGDGTGGFVVSNTNDFRTPLHRISEDINSFYEVTYDPHIENYDGKLRKIVVKTARADLRVQTRNGYFALPPGEQNMSTLPYEVPLLKALDTKPLPRTFPYRAAGFYFNPAGGEGSTRCALVVEVPMKDITFTQDQLNYKARISIVALLKDQTGRVMQKLTRDQAVTVPGDKLEGVKAGNYTYLENFALAPGRYTLESAVLDTEGNRISARKSVLLVPKRPAGVAVSSVTMVRRFDPNAADAQSPFAYEKGLITPTLNDTITAEKGNTVAAFFVIYPDKAIADAPKLTIQYVQDGKVLGKLEPTLPAADANGRIPYVASANADALPPGLYEIQAVVQQGTSKVAERTTFTIEAAAAPGKSN